MKKTTNLRLFARLDMENLPLALHGSARYLDVTKPEVNTAVSDLIQRALINTPTTIHSTLWQLVRLPTLPTPSSLNPKSLKK